MTVYALVPVFNRISHTKKVIECLRKQEEVDIQIVVVDDGSTDGTREFLLKQPDVVIINGTGNLWWAGAMDRAMHHVHSKVTSGDYLLFVNNDTIFNKNFVATLIKLSIKYDGAIVGSTIRDIDNDNRIIDIGARTNLSEFAIWDYANDEIRKERLRRGIDSEITCRSGEAVKVDFLSGRGTLYPADVIEKIGYLKPKLLPHYMADYEYSYRAGQFGYLLIVSLEAYVNSTDDFGNQRKIPSFWKRKFFKGSPENIVHRYIFFSLVGERYQRYSAVWRIFKKYIKSKNLKLF